MVNVSLVYQNDLYKQSIYISIGQDKEQFRQSACGKLSAEQIDEYTDYLYSGGNNEGVCFDTPGQIITVWVKELNRDAMYYGTLSHEIFHAVEAVMSRVNIRYSKSSSEAWAFLVGHITETVYAHLMEQCVI